jgi:hypothetical protein
MEDDKNVKLHPEADKSHKLTPAATQRMYVPGMGEVDLSSITDPAQLEKLEKQGLVVKKDTKVIATAK